MSLNDLKVSKRIAKPTIFTNRYLAGYLARYLVGYKFLDLNSKSRILLLQDFFFHFFEGPFWEETQIGKLVFLQLGTNRSPTTQSIPSLTVMELTFYLVNFFIKIK